MRPKGFEPLTFPLKAGYSTNWVTSAFLVISTRNTLCHWCYQRLYFRLYLNIIFFISILLLLKVLSLTYWIYNFVGWKGIEPNPALVCTGITWPCRVLNGLHPHIRAGDGAWTRNLVVGNDMLYQLSYPRMLCLSRHPSPFTVLFEFRTVKVPATYRAEYGSRTRP